MTYPGGKNGAGVYQQIINRIPPHSLYIEPFLGGGAIMRMKRPAASSIGIDADMAVIRYFPQDTPPKLMLLQGNALTWLATQTFHRGRVTEELWMNYPTPTRIHDYRYLGRDF